MKINHHNKYKRTAGTALVVFAAAAVLTAVMFGCKYKRSEIPAESAEEVLTEPSSEPQTQPSAEQSTEQSADTVTEEETESRTDENKSRGYADPYEDIDPDNRVRNTADTGVEWNMLLVNPSYILPKGFDDTIELETVQGKYKMDSRCAEYMKQMIAAAKENGIILQLCSAFRTYEKQESLYKNRINVIKSKYPDYTMAQVKAKAATINAYPGTSEHETGLAADIVTPTYTSLDSGFDKTDAYKWLEENCCKYGFILRYPKDKQEITEIIYEPWHYRYVGIDAATEIMKKRICLEEYLETGE